MDVHAIFVYERSVRTLPCRDTTSARSQGNKGGLNPGSAVPVEEVGLPGNFTVVEVGISQGPNVGLDFSRSI